MTQREIDHVKYGRCDEGCVDCPKQPNTPPPLPEPRHPHALTFVVGRGPTQGSSCACGRWRQRPVACNGPGIRYGMAADTEEWLEHVARERVLALGLVGRDGRQPVYVGGKLAGYIWPNYPIRWQRRGGETQEATLAVVAVAVAQLVGAWPNV